MSQLLRGLFALGAIAAGAIATYELWEAYQTHVAADALFRVEVAAALYLAGLWASTLMSLVAALAPYRPPAPPVNPP